jgi:hypothetical protein
VACSYFYVIADTQMTCPSYIKGKELAGLVHGKLMAQSCFNSHRERKGRNVGIEAGIQRALGDDASTQVKSTWYLLFLDRSWRDTSVGWPQAVECRKDIVAECPQQGKANTI